MIASCPDCAETNSELVFAPARSEDGLQTFEVTHGTMGALLSDPDRTLRRTAWESYADAHLSVQNTLGNCLAAGIKQLPLQLRATRPIDEAISTAGGVSFAALDGALMLHGKPGVFCAGEMVDWEAPTGGYLLTACLASGRVAAAGVRRWLGFASPP